MPAHALTTSFMMGLVAASASAGAPCFTKVPLIDELVAFQDSQGITLCSSATRQCLLITDQGKVLPMRPPLQGLVAPRPATLTPSSSPTVVVRQSGPRSFQLDVPEAVMCASQFDWSSRCDDSTRASFAANNNRLVAVIPGNKTVTASLYDLEATNRLWQLSLPSIKLSKSPTLVLSDRFAVYVGDGPGSAISFPLGDAPPSQRDVSVIPGNDRDLRWFALDESSFGALGQRGASLVVWDAEKKKLATHALPSGYPTSTGCVVNEFAQGHVFRSATQSYVLRSRAGSGTVGYAWDGRIFRLERNGVTPLALGCTATNPT